MKNILFVCHGNICRSPMAEFVMKELVKEHKLSSDFYIESAAVSSEELGNPVYPEVKRLLQKHNIDCSGKFARRITRDDYRKFDLLIAMDKYNIAGMLREFGGDPENKIALLLNYCGENKEVADPWYSGDFTATWSDVQRGCRALLQKLTEY